jgi:hypothetical protein
MTRNNTINADRQTASCLVPSALRALAAGYRGR